MINLRAVLVGITAPGILDYISALLCPVPFTREERVSVMDESCEWNEFAASISRVRDDLGIDLEGGTNPDSLGIGVSDEPGLQDGVSCGNRKFLSVKSVGRTGRTGTT